ncbi:MAG: hypothetical protein KTR26_00325 [Flammeovirgaceae bacterium]|nr:hypothetical protein [Flammeovirgaceae bacterium]
MKNIQNFAEFGKAESLIQLNGKKYSRPIFSTKKKIRRRISIDDKIKQLKEELEFN